MNDEEKRMIQDAIASHIRMLCRDIDSYKKTENKEAIKDCMNEIRKFKTLSKKISST